MKIYTMVRNSSDGHEAGIQKSWGLYNSIIPINYYNTLKGQELRLYYPVLTFDQWAAIQKTSQHITQVNILVLIFSFLITPNK